MTKTTYFKTLLAAIILLTLSVSTWSQAILPITASFSTVTSSGTGTLPTGFTHSGLAGYAGALKFDTQDDWLQLYFNATPGTLTFDLGANNTFPGTIPSTATFTVQESTDGSIWTSIVTYTNVAGGTKTITTLNNTTRYIRWFYTTKPSGTNISLKNLALTATSITTSIPVVSDASPTGTVGAAFTYNISASNSPTAFALVSGTLPAGLSLNTTTGAITGTPTAAGASSVTVTATNSVGTSAAATLSFNIAKASQTITFGALDSKTILDAAFDLTATASSGFAVSYSSSNTAVATVTGSTVNIVGIGSTSITASQTGNENYNAATPVSQTLTVGQYVAPTITITEITVPTFVATVGNTDKQTINVSGVNLTANVSLALSGANADQFTLSKTSVTQSGGVAPNTVITINYTPTTAGTHSATLTFSSAGAIDVTRTLSGTASWITLTVPTATAATNISTNGFTANWNAVEGATEYQLDVYYETAGGSGTTTIFSENFTGFSAGTTGATADATDISTSIDTYAQTTGWTGLKVYQAGGALKIGSSSVLGNITTPAMNLAANSGNFTVSFKAMAWSGDSTRIKVYLNDVLVKTIGGLTNDANYTMNTLSANLTGGTATSKLKFEGNQAAKGRFFIDDLAVTQVGGGVSQTTVTGSPFSITDATSKLLSELGSATTYKYTVIAKNAHSTSDKSNIISVETSPTGLSNPEALSVISVSNGSIKFIATAGETVEVYNTIGQKLVQQQTREGANTIQLRNQGVVLVKVGNRVAKVIL